MMYVYNYDYWCKSASLEIHAGIIHCFSLCWYSKGGQKVCAAALKKNSAVFSEHLCWFLSRRKIILLSYSLSMHFFF